MILIIGTPSGATHYIAEVLRRCGLDIGHERMRKDGVVDFSGTFWRGGWQPFRQYEEKTGIPFVPQKFDTVLHQVRHPLNVINSQRFGTAWEEITKYFELANCSFDIQAPIMLRTMQLWYYFHIKGEKTAELTYRVEDIENVFPEICYRIGIKLNGDGLKKVSKNLYQTKSKGDPEYTGWTWTDLMKYYPRLCKSIIKLARKYGYEISI